MSPVFRVCRALLLLPLLTSLTSGCDKAKGVETAKRLCAKDGGEHIFDTTFVAGYIVAERGYFCRVCIDDLVNGRFEESFNEITTRPADSEASVAYYRYTLGRRGDPHCETWQRPPVPDWQLADVGITGDTCVIVETLEARPKAPAFKMEWIPFLDDGILIKLWQWTLTDRDGRILAHVKDYQFTHWLTAMLDASGGGGNPDAKCLGFADLDKIHTLPFRVLRDAAKRPAL
jgi:hypothetical protein